MYPNRSLTFVLIHGSWADSSFWDGIAAELRRMGHIVYAPEYPGHGADPNIPKSYVYLMEDTALPQGSPMHGWHPHMSNRLGLYRFIQGHGDHMSTAKAEPVRLARQLYEAGRD